jgi:hypothetical protein
MAVIAVQDYDAARTRGARLSEPEDEVEMERVRSSGVVSPPSRDADKG